ncbi:MAG: biotin synthase auxiliary protein BsaP [Frankiaceae bacterium]
MSRGGAAQRSAGGTTGDASAPAASYCDSCGRPLDADDSGRPGSLTHARCAEQRTLEPPRYCSSCGRRLVVQVMPVGWTARCSRHGEISTRRRGRA